MSDIGDTPSSIDTTDDVSISSKSIDIPKSGLELTSTLRETENVPPPPSKRVRPYKPTKADIELELELAKKQLELTKTYTTKLGKVKTQTPEMIERQRINRERVNEKRKANADARIERIIENRLKDMHQKISEDMQKPIAEYFKALLEGDTSSEDEEEEKDVVVRKAAVAERKEKQQPEKLQQHQNVRESSLARKRTLLAGDRKPTTATSSSNPWKQYI